MHLSRRKVQEQYNKQNECASNRTTEGGGGGGLWRETEIKEREGCGGGRQTESVQHTHRRLELHSRSAILNTYHAHTKHMPCTCHAHAHAHRLEQLLRVFHKLDAKQDGKVCACMVVL